MSEPPPAVISAPVRFLAALTGSLLLVLAVGTLFMKEPGAPLGGLLVGFLGLLLLIPALKAAPLQPGVTLEMLSIRYRRARIAQWLCWITGGLGHFFLSRSAQRPSVLLVVLFSLLWFAGFALGGFAHYYGAQAEQLAWGRPTDAA